MSERWGFDLSMEAVRLMRRKAGHWQEVAREKIEGADIEDRLQALADRVDPPAPVFIFLPREQILYTNVKTSSEEAAAAEIDAAMDGRTPYALDQLEIDWEASGSGEARDRRHRPRNPGRGRGLRRRPRHGDCRVFRARRSIGFSKASRFRRRRGGSLVRKRRTRGRRGTDLHLAPQFGRAAS